MAAGCYILMDLGRAVDPSNRTEIYLKMDVVRKHWEWGRKTEKSQTSSSSPASQRGSQVVDVGSRLLYPLWSEGGMGDTGLEIPLIISCHWAVPVAMKMRQHETCALHACM